MRATIEHRSSMFSLIENWHQSGLSQKAFCTQHQIAVHQFQYWYRLYRTKKEVGLTKTEQGFIELHPQGAIVQGTVEVLLNDGHRIIFHVPVAAAYLKAIIS